MSSNELVILFGISYEVIASLLVGIGLIVFSVGVTSALIIVLFAIARRFFSLRRELRFRNNREEQGFLLDWLK